MAKKSLCGSTDVIVRAVQFLRLSCLLLASKRVKSISNLKFIDRFLAYPHGGEYILKQPHLLFHS